ncbi:unnamed protein product [Protopolystoma xenopodis]|uniref:Uncharacterized protein n=1 Tax=Protopolystoma xenopodis TaxID=117903 RepID=A0A3S5BLJ4_9PLAT|nr:unnamed protein product [Protopolystoma xenopodis]
MPTNMCGAKVLTILLEILDREEDIVESQRIRRESLARLINFAAGTTYFTFNRTIYEQIVGLVTTFGKRIHEKNRRELQDVTATTSSTGAGPG